MFCYFCGSESLDFMYQTDLEDELPRSIMEFYECMNCGRYVERRVFIEDVDPEIEQGPAPGENDS